MQEIRVKMKKIISVGIAQYLIEHGQGTCLMVIDARKPERLGSPRDKPRRSDRIPTGIKRNVVAELDQCLGQPPDDPFGPTVKLGRNGFGQGRDLRDTPQVRLLNR